MTAYKPADEHWMKLALAQARQALNKDEVPVGAVLVKNNRLVSANHNRTREKNDPLAHAEKLIIEDIVNEGHKYLQEYTLYITVEPCLMCAGMMIWARLGRVVFGCHDSKAGAAGSLYNVLQDCNLNHNPQLTAGVLRKETGALLKEFFKAKR